MARVLFFDFKHDKYFIGGEEVELADCLDVGDPLEEAYVAAWAFDAAEVIFGVGWKLIEEIGEHLSGDDLGRRGFLTDAAFAKISPYLPDGTLAVRMLFSISTGVSLDTGGSVLVQLADTDDTVRRHVNASWVKGVAPAGDEDTNSHFGTHLAATTHFEMTEGRHCVAVSFGPEDIQLSSDGGAVQDFVGTPDDFEFGRAWLDLHVAVQDLNNLGGQHVILERVEFYADPSGGGGGGGGDSPIPDLPDLSAPNPDGAGDGLVDDSVRMRCWSFSLDGHDFAVFRLGPAASLVYDLTTNSWSEWASPSLDYFRAHIGQNWLGAAEDTLANGSDIVAGDDESGVLWILDPEYGRDDRSTTGDDYFERVVTGGLSVSGRDVVPCGAVTVDLSVGAPTQTGATIQLEISDDFGHNFVDCGSETITAADRDAVVEWRALGTIKAPGRVFRFTDNGATVRLAAANLR